METRVKPGTRCECRHGLLNHSPLDACSASCGSAYQCANAADRMVTVQRDTPQVEGEKYIGFDEYEVPMCEPCARWHEKNK